MIHPEDNPVLLVQLHRPHTLSGLRGLSLSLGLAPSLSLSPDQRLDRQHVVGLVRVLHTHTPSGVNATTAKVKMYGTTEQVMS